jgi:hypothetical protein
MNEEVFSFFQKLCPQLPRVEHDMSGNGAVHVLFPREYQLFGSSGKQNRPAIAIGKDIPGTIFHPGTVPRILASFLDNRYLVQGGRWDSFMDSTPLITGVKWIALELNGYLVLWIQPFLNIFT